MSKRDPNKIKAKLEALRQLELKRDKWSREYAKTYRADPNAIKFGWGLGGAVVVFFVASYLMVRGATRVYTQIQATIEQPPRDPEMIVDPDTIRCKDQEDSTTTRSF